MSPAEWGAEGTGVGGWSAGWEGALRGEAEAASLSGYLH